MPLCKNDPKRKYKGDEPSPKGLGWCAHGEKEGKARKGRDGNKWITKKVSSGSLRWVKNSVTTKSVSREVSKSNNKNNCKNFVIYEKNETKKKFFGIFGENKILLTLKGIKGREQRTIHKFISYNNFEKKATKIPDGYTKGKLPNNDYINEFYCGNKEIKPKYKGYKSYFIHDNGGRPFLVYINKSEAIIYRMPELNNNYNSINKDKYSKLVKKIKFKKAYIGKSPLNEMKRPSLGYGKKFDGNSILLELPNKKCVFIGLFIYEFTLLDKIIKYYSPVGNNDVPYPFIIGDNYIYFMVDNKYLDKKHLPKNLTKEDMTDLYSYYHGHKGNEKLDKYAKNMKNIKIIQERI